MKTKLPINIFLICVLIAGVIVICIASWLYTPSPAFNYQPFLDLSTQDLNWEIEAVEPPQEEQSRPRTQKHVTHSRTKIQRPAPIQVSKCEDNPNAPDFLAKKLGRATGHEDDPCGRILWQIKF